MALVRLARGRGVSERQVARRLAIPRATLNGWSRRRRDGTLDASPLGRPPQRISRRVRAEVIEVIEHTRGRIGAPALRRAFPDVSRSRLTRLLRAYRRRHRRRPATLIWTTPGSVWAADFTEVTGLGLGPVDGDRRYILVVRDLASGLQLAALPVPHATAECVCRVLRGLIAAHGAPLVLKTDNGSHFTAGAVVALLKERDIHHLRSPARAPSYNGAAEAGIGTMKDRLIDGLPEDAMLHTDDVECARAEANAAVCPRRGSSADERWARRPRITSTQRAAFTETVIGQRQRHREILAACERRNHFDIDHDPNARTTVARRSIRDALLACGYLFINRSQQANTSTKSDADLAEI